MNLSHHVAIACPPEDVYRLLSDPENDTKWQSAVVAVRKVSPGPIGPGSQYKHTISLLGKPLEIDLTIVDTQPSSLHAFTIDTMGFVFETRVRFERTATGTDVFTDISSSLGMAANLAVTAIAHMRRAQTEKDLAALKRLLEGTGHPESGL